MKNILQNIMLTVIFCSYISTATGQILVEPLSDVDVHLSLVTEKVSAVKDVILKITLTNNTRKIQQLLFDKPFSGTGGPWRISGYVINVKSGYSMVLYHNKDVLSSQIYSGNQLKQNYYNLKPGKSISRFYRLLDIVILNNQDDTLAKGTYELQINYLSKFSNKVEVVIR